MRTGVALRPVAPGSEAPAPRNTKILQNVINEEYSRLSFWRLSVAFLIISVFWMVVELHGYIVWQRGGEKALLLVAVIASCIAIFINDRSCASSRKTQIKGIFPMVTLSLITLLVIYLVVSQLSSVYPQSDEIPTLRSLKFESVAIILVFLASLGGALAGASIEKAAKHLPIYILGLCFACLFFRFMFFIYYACGASFPHSLTACHVGIADIGGTTLNAVHAVAKGINPYTVDIQGSYVSDCSYCGYRYWPMMFVIYMPLTSFFPTGWGAMRLTNLILDLVTAGLIFTLIRRSGWLVGVVAASLYLMLPMLPMRLYGMVDTDLVPVVFLLAALAAYERRSGFAGMMVGLSVSAKIFPGVLMLICCLPEFRRSRYFGGFVLGLIPAIVFCLLAPSDFIYNTVWSVVRKPPDDSSWLSGAPVYLIGATRLAFILLMVAVSVLVISRKPDFFGRCVLFVICVVAALLTQSAHNNYMMWWIPFFCILLGSSLSRTLFLGNAIPAYRP